MIEKLLPSGVAVAESFGEMPDHEPMPAEAGLIARAVEKRRKEFVTTRNCAREALGQLGIDPVPIMRGENGEPLWPRQVVGSLTHCDGYRAAIAGYSMQVRSLGMDAEPHAPLPEGVLDAVSLEPEREVLAKRDDSVHWDRLLFCAKEATYKAWFPLTKRWLGFEDAHITFERNGSGSVGTFRSELLVDGATVDGGEPLLGFDGRWLVQDGLIIAVISL
ncbi:4'-phosphopantetheinyl transferase [Williamsia sp.]|uniref:4'-phosphopantetheinyl transferase family protein n=1 Tax=Williamsia sp. TaxID=1872085 RepID=UPI002F946268